MADPVDVTLHHRLVEAEFGADRCILRWAGVGPEYSYCRVARNQINDEEGREGDQKQHWPEL